MKYWRTSSKDDVLPHKIFFYTKSKTDPKEVPMLHVLFVTSIPEVASAGFTLGKIATALKSAGTVLRSAQRIRDCVGHIHKKRDP